MQKCKIPVFFHIPKNAGTYVLTKTMSAFRLYAEQNNFKFAQGATPQWTTLRRILVQNKEAVLMTLFVYDPEESYKTNRCLTRVDNYCSSTTLQFFLDDLLNNVYNLFSIIIEPEGAFLLKQNTVDIICNRAQRNPIFYTMLRHPLERALSLYNYLTSSISLHEPTHNNIKASTFEEYLSSHEVEDSWIIRSLTDINNNEIIEETHYMQACTILDKFEIGDVKNPDNVLLKAFMDYFPNATELPNVTKINKNEGKYDKSILLKLNEKVENIFFNRAKYDLKLYKKYCQHVRSE